MRSHQEKHVLFEIMVLTRMYEKLKETIQKVDVLMKFVIPETLSEVVSSLINMKFPYRVCIVVQMNCFHAELDIKISVLMLLSVWIKPLQILN